MATATESLRYLKSKFIPEIWKARITEAVYKKIALKYPKMKFRFEGQILRQGDIVWFPDVPHYHGLIADTSLITYFACLQSDLQSMRRTADTISDYIVGNILLSSGPGLFAGQITEIEDNGQKFGNLRTLFVYGHRSLHPIRLATEIIARCNRKGLSHDRTIKELERFF